MFDQPAQAAQDLPGTPPGEREVSEQDKKLAADWLKKIEAAQKRVEKTFATFAKNRKLLAGRKLSSVESGDPDTVRANLHFANMAAMRPQIYAKDPEFSAKPTQGVDPAQLELMKRFGTTSEFMLHKFVVKDAKLKRQAKKLINSTFTTSIGWLKASWQEKRGQDPLIANQIKDTQDNIDRLQAQVDNLQDPQAGQDRDLQLAQLNQTMQGLQSQSEIAIAKGIALDFLLSEDVLIIDASIRDVTDYTRASAMAHSVWMTPEQFQTTFKYKPSNKAKSYTEQNGAMQADSGNGSGSTLLRVWEIWSQDDNRIYYVCDGEVGFCKEPSSPEWTGKRWFPFFLLAFNEIDGSFYPLSDIELTEKLVQEHNQNREDQVSDRKEALPLVVVREGGSLTPDDVKNIKNRRGGDTIVVSGAGGRPLTDDLFMGAMAKLDGANYDTSAARGDMERILGGSDASTGSITKAKTATEAEILSQGLRSRSGERQDITEDMLNELGPYCLEIMLRKFTEEEVKGMAGQDAVWPQMGIDEIFNQINIEVRGGSTGKPDRLQEQDRWTKVLPIINEAVSKVAELRESGQDALAQAVIELTRETLRRFDERIDIEQFLPKKAEGADDPAQMKQQLIQGKQQMEAMAAELKDANEKLQKGLVSAAAQIATSQQPILGTIAFQGVMGNIAPGVLESMAAQVPQSAPLDPAQPGGELMPPGDSGAPPVPPQQTADMPQ